MASANKPPTDHRLEQAVVMRRRGATWELVAQRLHCSPDTVRKWPLYYPQRWQAAIRRTHADLAVDAEGEAAHSLRSLLNDEDGRIRYRAARDIINLKLDRMKRSLDGPSRRNDVKPDQIVPFILGLLMECSHDEVQKVLVACVRLAQHLEKQQQPAAEPVRPRSS